ncbi:MAG: MMPL family transporter [Chloracidobacterium sp.]|nr:MMPL family transporter [Chloracidobacterium sp.]
MKKLLYISVYHPLPTLLLAGLVALASICMIPRINLQLDGRSLIPREDPTLADSDRATRLFGLKDIVVVGVTSGEGEIYRLDTLRRLSRIETALSGMEGIVPDSAKSVLSAPRLAVNENRVETRSMALRLGDCQGDCDQVIRRIRAEAEARRLNDGILVSRDRRTGAILAEVEPGADRNAVLSRVRRLVAEEANGRDQVFLTGTALAQAVLGQSAASDLSRLIPAVIVVLALTLALSFRHPIPPLVSLIEIGISLIWTAGLMGAMRVSVFVTTLVLPVILMVIGISDDVYVMNNYFREKSLSRALGDREALIASFEKMFHPLMMTAISTVTGLLSMAVTNLRPLRVFGIFGAVSIVFSTIFTFTLVPALLSLLKPRVKIWDAPGETKVLAWPTALFNRLSGLRPGLIPALALLIGAASAYAATGVRVTDNWVGNLPASSDIVKGDRALNEQLSGTTALELSLDSGRPDGVADPWWLQALGDYERMISSQPSVGAVRSVYDDVLRLNTSLRGMNYEDYRAALESGRLRLGREEIEQALALLSVEGRGESGGSLRGWVDTERRRARLSVLIRSADYERIDAILRLAGRHGNGGGAFNVTPFGDGWVSYQTVRQLVQGQIWSLVTAFLTDLALLTLLMRSMRMPVIALTPIAFSLLLMFGLFALAGVPLGIANSMFAGIAIGIGLDYSIHLTHSYQRKMREGIKPPEAMSQAYRSVAPAIVTSATSIGAGCLMLVFSEVAPNVQLGLMICLSLLLCAAATLALTPAIIKLLTPLRWKVLAAAPGLPVILLAALILTGCGSRTAQGAGETASDIKGAPRIEQAVIRGAAPATLSSDRLLTAYNTRNIGSPGSRQVRMDLYTRGRLTRTFNVINHWKAGGHEVRTLFLLTERSGLNGTSYLLRERVGAAQPDMAVSLFLPAGEQRVLEVSPDSFDEGLLGSDFTYSDMRMLISTKGYRYRVAAQGELHGEPVWALESEALNEDVARQVGWNFARYYFAQRFQFLLGADYFAGGNSSTANAPVRQMRVNEYQRINGVWIAKNIIMSAGADRYSVLSLSDAKFGDPGVGAESLSPADLPRHAALARQAGAAPGNLWEAK